MQIRISLENRDEIQFEIQENGTYTLQVKGCWDLLQQAKTLRAHKTIEEIPVPTGNDHVSMMLREALLRAKNKWALPYQDEELCHCRFVPTKKVEQAIVAGAHDLASVGRACSAGITCGSCKPDIEALLEYRLSGGR
jgi:NAD(P)H-nitrite reductase large subunit